MMSLIVAVIQVGHFMSLHGTRKPECFFLSFPGKSHQSEESFPEFMVTSVVAQLNVLNFEGD